MFSFFFFLGGSDSNKGKSKKWRKILQFPHISQCIHLKDKLGKLLAMNNFYWFTYFFFNTQTDLLFNIINFFVMWFVFFRYKLWLCDRSTTYWKNTLSTIL